MIGFGAHTATQSFGSITENDLMNILSSVTAGASRNGLRMVVAGQEKMGKTTFAAQAPDSLLVPLEVGFAAVQTARTRMLQTFEEVDKFIDETYAACHTGQFPFKTIVFDSATALERFIHHEVILKDPNSKKGTNKNITIETVHGGYGRGHTMANNMMDDFLQKCDVFAINFGINIILTCHVFSNKVIDPNSGEYDSWDLLLHSPKNAKAYGKRERVTQWADVVGFLYEPLFVSKDAGGNFSRAVSQNKGYVMGLSRTPNYVAGNRFGILGEVLIPPPPQIGWNAFAHALHTKGIDVFNRGT